MLYSQETNRFVDQLKAMVGLAERWERDFAADTRIKELLAEFALFARNYYAFFATSDPATSRPHELSKALRSLQHEWETISRACGQRKMDEFKAYLVDADGQAQEYYDSFLGYKPTDVPPITYFGKLYAISRYVFTPYPLISIPLLVYNRADRWQALAHELGHFIYWHSATLSQYRQIHTRLRNRVLEALEIRTRDYVDFRKQSKIFDIWMRWIEEAFADICGTLLAGPEYALSGQAMIAERCFTVDDLIEDDEEHPLPYLRPLLATETLRWVAEQLTDPDAKQNLEERIEDLETRWQTCLGQNRDKARKQIHQISNLPVGNVEDTAKAVVRAILGGGETDSHYGPWVQADGQPRGLGELVDYNTWLSSLQGSQAAGLSAAGPELEIEVRVPQDIAPDPSSSFETLVAHLKQEHRYDSKVRKALLSLELQEEQPWICSEKKVRKVGDGKGNYEKCN